ncbi:MAG: ABC transporter ATP-binding protein [Woeseiaceae bacterium]
MTHFNLKFKNLKKNFGQRTLFTIPELMIESGKCCLLSGINGSGKTTLLKIIAGIEAPDHAEVYYKNQKLSWKSAYKKIHREIIYLHQTPLMFDASVEDNIKYGMRKQGYSKNDIQQQLKTALDWTDLTHLKTNNARTLSGGEKQRVALARAYVLSPQVLLLDEAFSNLDSEGRKKIFEQICKLKNEGVGIILTSHDLSHAASITEQHLQIKNSTLTIYNADNHSEHFENSLNHAELKIVNL